MHLVGDPSATISGARKKAAEKLADWVQREVRDAHGEQDAEIIREVFQPGGIDDFDQYYERFGRADHLSEVDTSVGRVYQTHVLAEIDQGDSQWIADTVALNRNLRARDRRVQTIAFAGAGVLGLVAMAHLFLRMGPAVTPVVKEETA